MVPNLTTSSKQQVTDYDDAVLYGALDRRQRSLTEDSILVGSVPS